VLSDMATFADAGVSGATDPAEVPPERGDTPAAAPGERASADSAHPGSG
jgi:hypothetical protein